MTFTGFPSETGQTVYERTYSRTKPDGTRETWPETVRRVVDGNLVLGGGRHLWPNERERLVELMEEFKILPAGRHLWATGVPGRQFLMNCWVSGWTDDPTEHFRFSFLRLMEGGGVGANYSNRYLADYPDVEGSYKVHIVCDPSHPDYEKLYSYGVLSSEYDFEWAGAFDVDDSREGWADALVDLVSTYYRDAQHQNRVFDVSRVRGEGSRLKTFGGRASGPLPLALMLREISDVMNVRGEAKVPLDGIGAMDIDHAIAKCVVSGGNRRSARMSIMRWDDPQIAEFLYCKRDTGRHWTTNISVEIDDRFFTALGRMDASQPRWVLDEIAGGMLSNGEPGFWNSSLSNHEEPNPVVCTNPCGEIPLEPWEPCNLGHINLAAFVTEEGYTDQAGLTEAHRLMTRFLIRATFADVTDEKSREVLDRNRRIGVGHFGVASYLALSGMRYSDAPGSAVFRSLLNELADEVEAEAQAYCHDFRIPVPVKSRTVAPTGTIAKMPGVSVGIHPIFAKYFVRRIRFSDVDPDQRATMARYAMNGYHVEPCQYAPATTVVAIPTKDSLLDSVEQRYGSRANEIVESADELSLEHLVSFQAMYQTEWADNAVSFTANIDPGRYTRKHIAKMIGLWGPELKGMTVFPDSSMAQAPYERLTAAEYYTSHVMTVEDSVDETCSTGACPVR